MAVNCLRPRETEEKKYPHIVATGSVCDSIYGCLHFIAKTPQAEAKSTGKSTYGIEEGKPCHWRFVPYKVCRQ